MITPKTNALRLPYRLAEILLIHSTDYMSVHWNFPGMPTMGFLQVDSHDWSEGELLKFAMDSIDLIYAQWDRIERVVGLDNNQS